MFLNALSLFIAPVIFFSVLCGIIGMNAGANVGRIGSKLIGLYFATGAVSILVGSVVSKIFFGGEVPQVATISSSQNSSAYDFSFIKFIVDIFPIAAIMFLKMYGLFDEKIYFS